MTLSNDLTFLAEPGALADWRAVVLTDAAIDAGLLAALPGTTAHVAATAGTDPTATRVVLDALAIWDVVTRDADDTYRLGTAAPDQGESAVIHQHAGVITRWAEVLGDRLAGVPPEPRGQRDPDETARWLDSLGTRARRRAPAIVDACLAAVPEPDGVLDLGGGHGEYALEFARRGLDVTMQDRDVVIDLARARQVLPDAGVELFAGDFFEVLPDRTFDLVLLAGVAHAHPPDVLEKLYADIRRITGRALVVSASIRDGGLRSTLFAVQMLSGAGGSTHTEQVHRDCLVAAGFDRVERHPMAGDERDLLVARVS